MAACSKVVIVKLAPHEYRHLVQLATLQGHSLSDTVREYLRLPPESEVQSIRLPADRHLRVVDGGR
jgi:hypothetical protein